MSAEAFGFRLGAGRASTTALRIAVVGAGIGGLSAALALARDGHQVVVFEQAATAPAVGAGIVIGPNALAILTAVGVSLADAGAHLSSFAVRDPSGRRIAASLRVEDLGDWGQALALSRPALQAALVAALPASVTRVFGSRLTPSSQELADFDLIVAADGLQSSFRAALHPGSRVIYTGQTCWRGLANGVWGDQAVEFWGDRVRLGVVPVSGDSVYYYLVASAARQAGAPSWPGGFARLVAGFPEEAGRFLLDADGPPPLHHDLLELDRPVWGDDWVVLLGDAAHAITPNQGQGAALAVEDAAALTLALRVGRARVGERYRAMRHARVRSVQLSSRRLGQAGHLPPAVAPARDLLLRAVPNAVTRRVVRAAMEPGLDLAALLSGQA